MKRTFEAVLTSAALLAALLISAPAYAEEANDSLAVSGDAYTLVSDNAIYRVYASDGSTARIQNPDFKYAIAGFAYTPDGTGGVTVSWAGEFAISPSMGVAAPDPDHLPVLNAPIIGVTTTATGKGFWIATEDGGVFTYGDAQFYGSAGTLSLNQPIVGIARTQSGNGYWLVAADGGIFSFGDARFFGSTGNLRLNQPVVGMSANSTGTGYWLVAADGGIFSFGGAQFQGSTGAMKLNQPIVAMITKPGVSGYWLLAKDGGMFTFGNLPFYGSAGNEHISNIVAGSWASYSL